MTEPEEEEIDFYADTRKAQIQELEKALELLREGRILLRRVQYTETKPKGKSTNFLGASYHIDTQLYFERLSWSPRREDEE